MKHVLRRSIVVVGIVLALAPVSAFADEQGNEQAIQAAKDHAAWLQNMPGMLQGVTLGQIEIQNAKAIAKLVPWDGHAQTEIPNSMQQYAEFCDAAIAKVAGKLANAQAMVLDNPGDAHAQAELANATTKSKMLWDVIGFTYGNNPWAPRTVIGPTPVIGDDEGALVADDGTDEMVMAEDGADYELVADDAAGDAVANEEASPDV